MLQVRRQLTIAAATAAALVFSSAARAADEQPPPSGYTPLHCSEPRPMPGFTPAVVDFKPALKYPSKALDAWSEGWALLEYAIRADGAPDKIVVVDAMGPKDFAEYSAKRLGGWRYKPATRNGVAVAQPLFQLSVLFLFEGSGRGSVHPEFRRKYNSARSAIQARDFDKAIELLEDALRKRVNLYEEAMGSLVLGIAYTQKGNWQRALFHVRHATIEDGNYLEDTLKVPAYALQVELEGRGGNFVEARCAFEKLQAIDPPSARGESEAAKIMARVETALKDPKPLVLGVELAKHPLLDPPAIWRHQLLRAKFSFADVTGDITSFRLACVGTEHEGPVDTETQWNVPADAGVCLLRVDGAPGATFKLVEEW